MGGTCPQPQHIFTPPGEGWGLFVISLILSFDLVINENKECIPLLEMSGIKCLLFSKIEKIVWSTRLECDIRLCSAISRMNAAYVPKTVVVTVVVDDFAVGKFWPLGSLHRHGWYRP